MSRAEAEDAAGQDSRAGDRRICAASELVEGRSRRFDLAPVQGMFGPMPMEGVALRVQGQVRAYLNLCPHRGQPLDLGDGRLFARDGTLECQAHGAHFEPLTGACVRGPCEGRALTPLRVEERAGILWVTVEPREEPVDDP
ncbi:MAG: Rieske (2Fe-2S) protein [Deltaproteobacteria bacterium]|nr:Rieske (2Fe-2S) protein [Deltaproteobacteria bacterium]